MKKVWKVKQIFSMLLIITMVASLSACGSKKDTKETSGTTETNTSTAKTEETSGEPVNLAYEPYEEELTITIGRLASQHTASTLYKGDTFENNPYTRYVKEKLNISFKDVIEADGDDYKNQIALATASGDIPEMFTVTNYDTLVDLVENDLIYDMTEYYDKYASDYYKSLYDSYDGRTVDMVTFDGKMMALPGTNADNSVPVLCWVRKDWLDKLNLNPDEDGDLCITVEDIEKVAKQFVDSDVSGNGTIGISLSDGVGDSECFANANGGYVDKWIDNGDGTVSWSTLLDPQFGTRTYDDVTSLLIDNKLGITFGAWHMPDWRFSHVKDAHPEAEYIAYTVKDSKGIVNTFHENNASNFVVVKKGYEHPEAAVKIMNVIYDDLARATKETAPEVMKFVTDGGDNFTRPFQLECLPSNTPQTYFEEHQAVLNGEMTPEQTTTAENKNTSTAMMEYLKDPKNVTEDTRAGWAAYNSRIVGLGASIGALQANGNSDWMSPLYPPTLPTMEQKKAALDTLELKAYIKIVTGEEPINYFDQFVEDWNSFGGEEIINELQEYYTNR
ncbi:MAG: sugar transporter substrate-binding protein [Anaerocolumna sp.]|nr:sugar transporter substrate-binding protein [Anaerocolumna sp.]